MAARKPATRVTEPAADPAATDAADATNTPTSPTDAAVTALLRVLDTDPRAVKSLEIRPQGVIRLFLHDNSARSLPFTPLPRYERDREGRIIE